MLEHDFGTGTFLNVTVGSSYAVATNFDANGGTAYNATKVHLAAVYLQDQIALSKDWKLLAGLRCDHFKTRFDDRRTLVAATDLARTDRNDVKVVDPNNAALLIQAGQQRTEGVELGLQGAVTKNWEIYAGYTNLDGRIVKGTTVTAGRRVGLVPQDSFSMWNKLGFGGSWSAGLAI